MEAPKSETKPTPELPADRPYYSTELLLVRHAAQRRRAAAMVATHDIIKGFRFLPLTPASYSRLLLIESPFLWKQPAGAAAVRDYLWQHWPAWNIEGRGRAAFLRAFERRMCPAWLRFFYSRPAWRAGLAEGYAEIAVRITELMAVAFADESAPALPGAARQICATLEAQLIDLFAKRYAWTPERTRATPIRQLYQFIRCNDASDYAPDEAAIIAEDLRRENEAAAATRLATPVSA